MLLKDIAEKLGAKLIGNGDLEITHVANLKTAAGGQDNGPKTIGDLIKAQMGN